MAIAVATSRAFLGAAIIGAIRLDQRETEIAAADLAPAPEVLQGIEEIHPIYTDPCP